MKNIQKELKKLKALLDVELHDNILKLCSVWSEIGIVDSQITERSHKVAYHLNDLLSEMIEEDGKLKAKLIENAHKYTLMASQISSKLQVAFEEPRENMTILEREREMKYLVESLQKEREDRIDRWQRLMQMQRDCSALMLMIPEELDARSEIPSIADIEFLELQVYDVQKELEVRKKQMSEQKKMIKRLVGELDHKVDQQDRIYLADEVGDLLYSNENLKLHKTFVAKLEKIKKLNLSKIALYKEELKKPFEFKMEGEGTFKEEEFGYFCPASGDLVKALKEQVLARKQRIESTIRSKQTELRQWWEKCQVSCGHKDEKKDLLNGDSEKVDCSALKEELLVMESYYNDNKEILDLQKSFRDTFAELSEAERKCINASRRLNNMGSTKEDKPRNKLLRDISKIKQKLASKVEHYEDTTGTKFLFRGLHLSEYLEQMQNQLQSNMEAWKIDGGTPASSRHSCCGNHILRTPTSQKKEEHFKNFKKSSNRLSNRQQTPQDPGQHVTSKKESQSSNNGGKYGADSKPPRPGTVVRRPAQSNQAVPRSARTKTCRPTSANKAADTRIEISEIENLDENFLNATASYEEFYKNLASNTSFISSSILEHPNSPKKQRKHQFLMPPLYS